LAISDVLCHVDVTLPWTPFPALLESPIFNSLNAAMEK
jgi:hypothetical protein